jgi:hypothetical protein
MLHGWGKNATPPLHLTPDAPKTEKVGAFLTVSEQLKW